MVLFFFFIYSFLNRAFHSPPRGKFVGDMSLQFKRKKDELLGETLGYSELKTSGIQTWKHAFNCFPVPSFRDAI